MAVAAMAQVAILAWIAAWQQRAAHEVRKLNGHVEQALTEVRRELEAVKPE